MRPVSNSPVGNARTNILPISARARATVLTGRSVRLSRLSGDDVNGDFGLRALGEFAGFNRLRGFEADGAQTVEQTARFYVRHRQCFRRLSFATQVGDDVAVGDADAGSPEAPAF